MKRCLITGCEGFIGSHLAELLKKKQFEIFGLVYAETTLIDHLENDITFLSCDVRNKARVSEVIDEVKPDVIFHLAAQSFVTVSWQNPEETLSVNVLGTLNLLESIRKTGTNPLIEIISSSAVYGYRNNNEMPIKEDSDYRPTSIYSVSKISEDMLGYFYHKVYGLNVIRVRPFNTTGPRKYDDACSDFTKGIIEIEKGFNEKLSVGSLDTIRDFTDVRDAVKALWLLSLKGVPGEAYNICSNRGYKMEDILNISISLSDSNIPYHQSDDKLRPFDDPIYIGDNTKITKLGWTPKIQIEQTLSDMLSYWRRTL